MKGRVGIKTQGLFTLMLLLMLSPLVVQAELGRKEVPLFKPQRLSLGMELQSFKSRANYSGTRQSQDLIAGNEFLTFDMLLSATYDFSDYWAFTAGAELVYGESYDHNYRRSTRRFRGLSLGVYRLLQVVPSIFIIADAHYFLNLTTNSISDDDVSIDDGTQWAQMGVWLVHELSPHFVYKLYAGYRSRSKGYADYLVYRVGPEVRLKNYGAGLNFMGLMSVTDDSSSAALQSERQQINTLYNAGSLRYNAKNPHIEEVALWISYEFDTLSSVKLGAHQVLGLENTADGFGFLFEVQASFRVDEGGFSFPYFTKTTKRAKYKGNRALLKNLGPDPRDKGAPSSSTPVVPANEF
ncbi:MAG: hypothetical protein M9899_02790 [Bdellovibrionaceae bacterium]|nr:hypothetical protein [Pseudobdellovibrionaceae bacterium]